MGQGENATKPVRLLRAAVPTSRHAEMLFRMAADRLGADGYIESAEEGKLLVLFRRARADAAGVVPWPILRLRLGGRIGYVMAPGGTPSQAVPEGRGDSRLRGAGPGEVVVHDGPEWIAVTYDGDGNCFETSRSTSPETLASLVPALDAGTANPVELVADHVARGDAARHGPGTVVMPVPLPGALGGVWTCGLHALRRALFHGQVPDDARWAAADGYAGVALVWGATREEALERWRAEVERLRPAPPEPRPVEPPPGAVMMRGPKADGESPAPAPDNTPAAVVQLAPPPSEPPRFGAWVRLLDRFGATVPAALRRDVAGFTLVGDRLLAALDDDALARLDETLEGVVPPSVPPGPDGVPPPAYNCHVRRYVLVDEKTGEPVEPRLVGQSRRAEFDPQMLEAGEERWYVVRQRWLDLDRNHVRP